jgi:hypothetical protein
LDRANGSDETGFARRDDATYLRQAWSLLLAGDGLFDILDYSFTAGYRSERCRRREFRPAGPARAVATYYEGKLLLDHAKGEISNNREANRWVKPAFREGWELKL